MAGLRRFRSAAVSKSWLIAQSAYRAGTGAGGRNRRDRDAPVAAGRFAVTRFPLSMDSR